jgi:ABC-type dipeptide/oligopeptide/nickel transport system permease component
MPPRMKPLLLSVGLALIGLSVPTWKFGARFLIQFFVSPFQFFIAPLWLLAYYAVRTGVMPMKSGRSLRRDEDPSNFWRNVRFCILMGAVMFVFNLWISWQVMSR